MARASVAEDRAVSVPEVWAIRGGSVSLAAPVVMGVLNATPDSFSDGGRFLDPDAAARRAVQLVEEGAGILDVGGESTRPGAEEIPAAEEVARVVPVIEAIRRAGVSVPISIDTRKSAVARAALAAGAAIVNDVSALSDPEMAAVAAEHGAGLVLMHMKGTPRTMQERPEYDDVTAEVADSLAAAMDRAALAGVAPDRIALDPGIGFGKTVEHNLTLIREIPRLLRLGRPVLLGVSRKAFIGRLLGDAPPERRVHGTVGACVAGFDRGARIFRVHDVRPAVEALRIAHAVSAGAGIP